jgi:integrase
MHGISVQPKEHINRHMNIKPVVLKGKVNADGKTNIKIRITHQRKTREIPTKFYIEVSEKNNPWDTKNNRLKKDYPNAAFINTELKRTVLLYEDRLLAVRYDSWSIEKVLMYLKSDGETAASFYGYFEKFIARKSTENKRTAQIYRDTLSKVKELIKDPSPNFADMTLTVLRDMESQMRTDGLKTNSISIHLKNIRSVFNAAIDEEVIGQDVYPFRRMSIKFEKGPSKALTVEQLKGIRDMDGLSGLQLLARNAFMLSFCLIGINNGDMYHLKELGADGRIRYSRAKTHRQYNIKVEPEAMAMIEVLRGQKALVCLADRYANTAAVNLQLNKALKHIGDKLGIRGLTMYHARHTWATIAAGIDIPKETIAAALGHGGSTVTDTYISFDAKKIDEANRRVLDAVL